MKLLVLLLLLGVAVGGVGCGASHEEAASADLEAILARQLPAKVREALGPSGRVEGVRCIHEEANRYGCIASISASNSYSGIPEEVQLPISATCDGEACIWKLSP